MTKYTKPLFVKMFLISLTAIFANCSSSQVYFDYDRSVDFAKYTTYKVEHATPEEVQKMKIIMTDKLYVLEAAIHDQMKARGYKESEDADIIIVYNVNVETQERVNNTTVSVGGGSYYGGVGFGYSVGKTIPKVSYYKTGTVMIDLVDSEKKELVWHGAAQSEITKKESQIDSQINYVVKHIFSKYKFKVAQ
ncbi:DUF4136 domain-containing protein [Flammeovirgaceae bacterium SG7u.111]|nr:DUF4136 domain-containing protein [Flammeovirgaceae bacterium SG7u.132]WPO35108.1 DUF4136 domain-containing protein [Flammeovirgaceae bacterium SG7u.111]